MASFRISSDGLNKSQDGLLRSLSTHKGWPLYRRLSWKEYHDTCVAAQENTDPVKKLALLSKAEGIRIMLDKWKEIIAQDEDVLEEAEETS